VKTMRRQIILSIIVIVIIIGISGIYMYKFTKASVEVEIYPTPPIEVTAGESFTLEISVRNNPGLHAEAKNVFGELLLPDGFLEEYFNSRERGLIFGDISPGDACHYGLNIKVSSFLKPGEYHAKLIIQGDNIPKETIDITIIVS